MEIIVLHDKHTIYQYLKKQPELQVYCLGDLDAFFWPKTVWYALYDRQTISAIALLYVGLEIPTLLSFYHDNQDAHLTLLEMIKSILPGRFYAHLSPGLQQVFGKNSILEHYGMNYKMALQTKPEEISDPSIQPLTINDYSQLIEFYTIAYPNNWFDKRMLETGKYVAYYADDKIIGIAGVHVYSADYKVAALGNIAVHPNFRGRQIAYKLTSALCTDLQKSVDIIGLNVKSDNDFAIRCYKKIGFEIVGKYDECLIRNG